VHAREERQAATQATLSRHWRNIPDTLPPDMLGVVP
jgi:hypothetical protein